MVLLLGMLWRESSSYASGYQDVNIEISGCAKLHTDRVSEPG